MPFITEEIYQENFFKNEKVKSIHLSSWPDMNKKRNSGKDFEKIMDFNSEVWKRKKDDGKTLRDEIKIKIPKSLEDYKKDLVAMHNIR
jgi:valyl-tRNA synthetase